MIARGDEPRDARVMWSPGYPCCCGGAECVFCFDTFERPDGDPNENSPCGWEAVSGAWEIASGALTTAGGGGGLILTTAESPADDASVIIESVVGGANRTARVIVNYADANNYHYAEANIHGSLRLVEVAGGVHTQLAVSGGPALPNPSFVTVCFLRDMFTAKVAWVDNQVLVAATVATPGVPRRVGAATINGARFHDFEASRVHDEEHPACPICSASCDVCCGTNQLNLEWIATIAGAWTTVGNCDCTVVEGVFVLRPLSNFSLTYCSRGYVEQPYEEECNAGNCDEPTKLAIDATFIDGFPGIVKKIGVDNQVDVAGHECALRVMVQFFSTFSDTDPCNFGRFPFAEYVVVFTKGECTEMFTLTKLNESTGEMCGGALPETITLKVL